MKNIHLISTDKPSRLFDDGVELYLEAKAEKQYAITNYNLYITNSEKIKVGDYYVHGNRLHKHLDKKCLDVLTGKEFPISRMITDSVFKKIILTTDQDLIKDRIQPIDDKFLEWFVKNPSCEKVEVENYKWSDYPLDYKIIIPKEEFKDINAHTGYDEDGNSLNYKGNILPLKENKQETLEEVAERMSIGIREEDYKDGFIDGAKWQKDRMYSEEEVKKISTKFFHYWKTVPSNDIEGGFDYWIDQFKNKIEQ